MQVGSSWRVSASTAATHAVGKRRCSTGSGNSSFGARTAQASGATAFSLARLASTSFVIHVRLVPEPVCQTTKGNSSPSPPLDHLVHRRHDGRGFGGIQQTQAWFT